VSGKRSKARRQDSAASLPELAEAGPPFEIGMQPEQRTATANAKELSFDALDSGYKIDTAGTKGGRALVDHPALPWLRGGILAARRDACQASIQ
jgi:hypothetical protein